MRNLILSGLILIIVLIFGCNERAVAQVTVEKTTTEYSETFIDGVPTSATRVLSIHKTGFLRNKRIKIEFRLSDGQILSVFKNGKEVPASKYDKYEHYVTESMEYDAITSLQPEYKFVLELIENPEVAPGEKLKALEDVLRNLDTLESSSISSQKSHLEVLKEVIESENLQVNILEFMQKSEDTWVDEVVTVTFKKGTCTVNDIELNKAQSRQVLQIYEEMRGSEVKNNETVHIYF